jgi:hypothetical protein
MQMLDRKPKSEGSGEPPEAGMSDSELAHYESLAEATGNTDQPAE